jgi:GNAT superfamily N-acetyltransferase
MSEKLALRIDTAAPRNIAALARIHVAAFEKDKCWQSMHRGPSYWAAMNGMLENHFVQSDYEIKIAMVEKNGKNCNAGWLCCSIVGDPAAPPTHNFAYMEWTTAAAFVVDSFEEWQTQKSGRQENEQQCRRRRELFNIISRKFGEVQRKTMLELGNTKYLVINTLVTDPPFRGQGVGSELLRWATELADKERISIWAQVPKGARGIFQRAGFAEVDGSPLVVDIVDPEEIIFCSEPEKYEILFMVREARSTS